MLCNHNNVLECNSDYKFELINHYLGSYAPGPGAATTESPMWNKVSRPAIERKGAYPSDFIHFELKILNSSHKIPLFIKPKKTLSYLLKKQKTK